MDELPRSILGRVFGFLTKYTLVILSLVTIASMLVAFIYLSGASKQILRESSVTDAQRYLEALAEFRTLYTSEVVQTAKKHGLTVSHDYQEREAAIPLPATFSMKLGERIGAHRSGAKTFLYSLYPFPWREDENKQLFSQTFPRDAWENLKLNPGQPFYRFEHYEGRSVIRFAIADKMREACVNCHNTHPDSPKTDWRVGDVRGVLEVVLPVSEAQLQTQSNLQATFLVLGLMAVLLTFVLWVVFTRLQRDTRVLADNNASLRTQKLEIEQKNVAISHAHKELESRANELERANQTKSDFLACMSHEIRTPMNGVIGMLGLLRKSELTTDQDRKADIAQSSANSLLALINDILDFSKIDAGKLELEIIDFDLNSLLSEFVQTMAFRAQEKGLELILDTSELVHFAVKGDPSRLVQIMTNLVSNAIKFTDQGEIVVRAKLQQGSDNTCVFHCSVTDTGIGIRANKLPLLFDTFTQADASTTREYGGTGLGLSICKSLCEQMGGKINVTSVAGAGSRFEFYVTLGENHDVRRRVPTIKIDKLNILVVDDNTTNREILRGQLEPWGALVQEADSGQAALQQLEENLANPSTGLFDIGIIDMQMPVMDGAQLATILKADTRFRDIKLIMMTSMAGRGDAEYFAELGFRAYFSKPVTPSDLFGALLVLTEDGETLQEASPLVTHHYLRTLTDDTAATRNRESDNVVVDNGLRDIRILLVEDNEINQHVALGILESLDLSADIAADGEEALQALSRASESDRYHVVLMDCQMPRMDGFQASRHIRTGKAGEFNRSIPIIAMTANAMKGDREKCLAAGMNDYMSKPIEPEELHAALVKWLAPSAKGNVDLSLGSHGIEESTTAKTPAELSSLGQRNDNSDTAESPAAMEHSVLWDKEATIRRIGGKEKILHKLLEMFARDMPERMEALKQAVDNENRDEVEHLAHVIRGIAANLGAILLQDLAKQLQSCKEPALQQQLMNGIDSAYLAISTIFDKYMSARETDI